MQSINVKETYKKVLPELQAYLYRLTCDREVSKDLSHDTFVKAQEKQNQFRGESSFKTWLFSIATNLAMDWLRKRKQWNEFAQDEAKALAQSESKYRDLFLHINRHSPSGLFEIKEHINFCFTCIAKTLTIKQQVALILKDIYDFKISEIVQILDTPKGTVKHWLFTARKTMNEIFERRCALVNKKGVCHQCSELNGLFNPKQKQQQEFLSNVSNKSEDDLYRLRTEMIKGIDPLTSRGADLEDAIMQVLREAISDD